MPIHAANDTTSSAGRPLGPAPSATASGELRSHRPFELSSCAVPIRH
jgi:hypothetical protein